MFTQHLHLLKKEVSSRLVFREAENRASTQEREVEETPVETDVDVESIHENLEEALEDTKKTADKDLQKDIDGIRELLEVSSLDDVIAAIAKDLKIEETSDAIQEAVQALKKPEETEWTKISGKAIAIFDHLSDKKYTTEQQEAISRFQRIRERMEIMADVLGDFCVEKIQKNNNLQEEERVAEAQSFFERQDKGVGGRKETPIGRLAVMYENLNEKQLSDAVKQHMSAVIKLALDQHVDNPEQFVSHGFDHTLNVMDYTKSIYENNPEIVAVTMKKYGVSEGVAKFILENVALFHDFGYPETEALRLKKSAHAMQGAEILMGKNIQESFEGILQSAKNPKQVIKEILESVLYHAADKVEVENYPVKVVTNAGEYLIGDINDINTVIESLEYKGFVIQEIKTTKLTELSNMLKGHFSMTQVETPFKGRSVDLKKEKDRILGIEYAEIDLLKDPLRGIIRVADNMDMKVNRLSELQRDPLFQGIYHDFGEGSRAEYLKDLEDLKSNIDKFDFENIKRQSIFLLRAWVKFFGVKENKQLTKKKEGEKSVNTLIRELKVDAKSQKEKAINLYKHIVSLCDSDEAEKETERKKEVKKLLNELDCGIKDSILARRLEGRNYSPQTIRKIKKTKEIANKDSSYDLRHFGGCEGIKNVELKGKKLVIQVVEDAYERLNQTRVVEGSVKVGVGEYQIWRAQEAYKSLSFGGEKIEIVVQNEKGEKVFTSFPLSEFDYAFNF